MIVFLGLLLFGLLQSRKTTSTGMSAGEFSLLLSLIPKTIQVLAFAVLVVGLYKMWGRKKEPA